MTTLTERPSTRTRPTGGSFVSLVLVEVRRLWWRRMTKVCAVVAIALAGMAIYGVYRASSPEYIAQQLEMFGNQQANCLQEQQNERDRSGDQSIDFGCSQMPTTSTIAPEDLGLQNPLQPIVTATTTQSLTAFFGFLGLVLGASLIAAEFSTGAMGTWLTFSPRRWRVGISKLIGSAAAGLFVGAAGVGTIALGAWLVATINRPDGSLKFRDGVLPFDDTVTAVILRCLALMVLGAVGGGALALLLRHTAAVLGAVIGGIIVMMMAINLPMWSDKVQHLSPERNFMAVVMKQSTYYDTVCRADGNCEGVERVITAGAGWTYFLVLAGVAVVLALVTFRRRDVN